MSWREQIVNRWRNPKAPHLSSQVSAIAFVALACITLLGFDLVNSWNEYGRAVERTRETSSNLARAVGQQADDTFRAVDILLTGLVDRVEINGVSPLAIEQLHGILQRRRDALRMINGMLFIDDKGNSITGSQATPIPVNVADRDYFQFHQTHPDRVSFIGRPVQSRVTGAWIIPFSRRINRPDGSFGGVMLATLDIKYFVDFYHQFEIGERGAILLGSLDGWHLARNPFDVEAVGRDMTKGVIFTELLRKGPVGTAEIKSVIDGIVRFTSYRRTDVYPLVVAVSVAKDDALADWRRDTKKDFIVAITMTLGLAALGFWIARRRQLGQRAIVKAMQHAEQMSNAKSEFLANMSHEIRTPINGILGMNELLLGTRLDNEQKHYADILKKSAQSLLVIINDILDVSKLESGKVVLETMPVSLFDKASNMVSLLKTAADDKGIGLTAKVDKRLDGMFIGDPTRLRQILLNLIGNAIKFTDHGDVKLHIYPVETAAGVAGTGLVRFDVRDTGIGMDAAACARMFQKFEQADSSITRRFGGTGLGLAISRHLVEMMGGKIGVTSEPGVGSVFWFTIPLARAIDDQMPSPSADKPSAASNALNGFSLRVLVADDNPTNQEYVGAVLRKAGCRVDVVDNGRQAVQSALYSDYDVILMDIQMPELDGVGATKQIRALGGAKATVPIVALTADAMSGAREQYLAAGMTDYLTKPINSKALFEKIARLVDVKKSQATSVETGSQTPAAFDPMNLNEMATIMDAGRLAGFVESYVTQADVSLAAIRSALSSEDYPLLARTAHGLVGSSGTLGAVQVSALAREIEQACKKSTVDVLPDMVAELERAVARSVPPLRDWLDRQQRKATAA